MTDVKMDEKLVLRSDGTSVYMTQDLGTANIRYGKYKMDGMIYVVADEQDYHFKVLFEILKRLGEPYAAGLHHLSYGMVNLPQGRMKSREGTVVDADDLIAEVIALAKSESSERGELAEISADEQADIFRKLGLGALKYHILKVGPKKSMVFDPSESVDMQGQTGPYIQNAYVRIRSILRKNTADAATVLDAAAYQNYELLGLEKDILQLLHQYPSMIVAAANAHDPSDVCTYAYTLAKSYHRFYHDIKILGAESEAAKQFRLALSEAAAQVLAHSLHIIGVEMPERM